MSDYSSGGREGGGGEEDNINDVVRGVPTGHQSYQLHTHTQHCHAVIPTYITTDGSGMHHTATDDPPLSASAFLLGSDGITMFLRAMLNIL